MGLIQHKINVKSDAVMVGGREACYQIYRPAFYRVQMTPIYVCINFSFRWNYVYMYINGPQAGVKNNSMHNDHYLWKITSSAFRFRASIYHWSCMIGRLSAKQSPIAKLNSSTRVTYITLVLVYTWHDNTLAGDDVNTYANKFNPFNIIILQNRNGWQYMYIDTQTLIVVYFHLK